MRIIRVPEALDVASFNGTAEAMMTEIRTRMQVAIDPPQSRYPGAGRFQNLPESVPVTVGHLLQVQPHETSRGRAF